MKELIEKYIKKLIDNVDFEYWIEQYGIDVYTFLTCNIPYNILSHRLMGEAYTHFLNAEELRLLYREKTIKLFNKEKNNVLLNRLDALMDI